MEIKSKRGGILVLLCSRHHPPFLQRSGTGSHLYTANLHTLRWTSSGVVLLTLVGLTLRVATPSFHYYYTTLDLICQEVFQNFFILFYVFSTDRFTDFDRCVSCGEFPTNTAPIIVAVRFPPPIIDCIFINDFSCEFEV